MEEGNENFEAGVEGVGVLSEGEDDAAFVLVDDDDEFEGDGDEDDEEDWDTVECFHGKNSIGKGAMGCNRCDFFFSENSENSECQKNQTYQKI